MNIFAHWGKLLTPSSLKNILSLWWRDSKTFFRILLRDWWPLVIVMIGGYGWFFPFLMERLKPVISALGHTGDFSLLLGFVLFLPLILLLGLWGATLLLIAHPTTKEKDKRHYRSHILFYVLVALLAGITLTLRMYAFAAHPELQAKYAFYVSPSLPLKQLFYIFSSFFILSAGRSIREYVRAMLWLPIKFFALNLPAVALLYVLLIPLNMAPSLITALVITPLFMVLCGVLYKLAVQKNREDY